MVVCAAPGLPSGWCGLSRWASVADHGALSVGHGEHRRWVGGHVLVESPPHSPLMRVDKSGGFSTPGESFARHSLPGGQC
jgi:hypothetical protein